MEQEIRSFNIELRANPESRVVEGIAIPFNVQSPNREGFREMIVPEAVEGVIEVSDILMLYNHDKSKGFLARSNKGKGSLVIDVQPDGVHFAFEAKHDDLSNYVYERLLAGELDETSWAFTVKEDVWKKGEDGVYDRTITKFDRLYDFSVVNNSYYGVSNAVGCKRYAEILEEEKAENERKLAELKAEEERQAAEAEEARKQALAEYYANLKEEYKDILEK